jgi:hypothetical protein
MHRRGCACRQQEAVLGEQADIDPALVVAVDQHDVAEALVLALIELQHVLVEAHQRRPRESVCRLSSSPG